MIGLVQRVRHVHVEVRVRTVGAIDAVMPAFVCAEPANGDAQVRRFAARLQLCRHITRPALSDQWVQPDGAGGRPSDDDSSATQATVV